MNSGYTNHMTYDQDIFKELNKPSKMSFPKS